MSHRRQRAVRAVERAAGPPRPKHQRRILVVLQQLRPVHVLVLRAIGHGPTNLGTRQRLVIDGLPRHRKRREVPIVLTWHSDGIVVPLLMARRAIEPRDAMTLSSSNDMEEMTMAIVALLRIVARRVAIEAARMHQNRVDLIPCTKAVDPGCGR